MIILHISNIVARFLIPKQIKNPVPFYVVPVYNELFRAIEKHNSKDEAHGESNNKKMNWNSKSLSPQATRITGAVLGPL